MKLVQPGRRVRTVGQSNVDAGDRSNLEFHKRFNPDALEPRSLFDTIDHSGDLNQALRDDVGAGGLIEIRKRDDLHESVQVFKLEVGHPIALLGHHWFDSGDNAAEFDLVSVGNL